ncbi:MAG: hypothetical protein F4Y02_13680 [Chloroflexi bacterium]|nr:hypothetical protein [Chloroflexota bacterium]
MFVPVIANGHASPRDLDTTWTLDEVYEYNESLSVTYDNQRRISEHAANQSRSGSRGSGWRRF